MHLLLCALWSITLEKVDWNGIIRKKKKKKSFSVFRKTVLRSLEVVSAFFFYEKELKTSMGDGKTPFLQRFWSCEHLTDWLATDHLFALWEKKSKLCCHLPAYCHEIPILRWIVTFLVDGQGSWLCFFFIFEVYWRLANNRLQPFPPPPDEICFV